jgi:sec-independent protein translocase protein TatC
MAVNTERTIDPTAEGRMTLSEHIGELRNRLFKSVVAVVAGGIVCWIFYFTIKGWFEAPLCSARPDDCELIILDPLEGFKTRVRVCLYGGIALAIPVILWQIWKFVMPALYPNERRYAIPFVFFGVVLFSLGAGLGFWVIPRGLDFLISVGGFEPNFQADAYFKFITSMMLAFGVGFQFPIVLVFLQITGLLDYRTLVKVRRYAIVGIVVLAAVISPTGDPISLLVLSLPLYIFYEIAIVFGWVRGRRRALPEDA